MLSSDHTHESDEREIERSRASGSSRSEEEDSERPPLLLLATVSDCCCCALPDCESSTQDGHSSCFSVFAGTRVVVSMQVTATASGREYEVGTHRQGNAALRFRIRKRSQSARRDDNLQLGSPLYSSGANGAGPSNQLGSPDAAQPLAHGPRQAGLSPVNPFDS